MTSARWRKQARESRYALDLLYHVSDGHGQHGALPDFAKGETWESMHEELHDRGDFGGREPHDHEEDGK